MADTQKEQEKSWLDSLSEILSRPLPGTAVPGREPIEKPVVFNETDDDDSLLDRITDILSKPISGADAGQAGQTAGRENPGEAAVRDAAEPDADPVSTTAWRGEAGLHFQRGLDAARVRALLRLSGSQSQGVCRTAASRTGTFPRLSEATTGSLRAFSAARAECLQAAPERTLANVASGPSAGIRATGWPGACDASVAARDDAASASAVVA